MAPFMFCIRFRLCSVYIPVMFCLCSLKGPFYVSYSIASMFSLPSGYVLSMFLEGLLYVSYTVASMLSLYSGLCSLQGSVDVPHMASSLFSVHYVYVH